MLFTVTEPSVWSFDGSFYSDAWVTCSLTTLHALFCMHNESGTARTGAVKWGTRTPPTQQVGQARRLTECNVGPHVWLGLAVPDMLGDHSLRSTHWHATGIQKHHKDEACIAD